MLDDGLSSRILMLETHDHNDHEKEQINKCRQQFKKIEKNVRNTEMTVTLTRPGGKITIETLLPKS